MTSIVQNLTRYKLKKRTQDHVKVGADESTQPWSSLVEGDEGCIDPSGKLSCLWQTPPKLCNTWMASFNTYGSIHLLISFYYRAPWLSYGGPREMIVYGWCLTLTLLASRRARSKVSHRGIFKIDWTANFGNCEKRDCQSLKIPNSALHLVSRRCNRSTVSCVVFTHTL